MNARSHPSHKRSWANHKERTQNLQSICQLENKLLLIHPEKWTWNPKMVGLEVDLLFNLVICRFPAVHFQGCRRNGTWNLKHQHPTLTQRFFTRLQLLQLFSLHTYLNKWPRTPPWDWYIYLHSTLMFMVDVGKYTIHGCYGWCQNDDHWISLDHQVL